MKKFVFILHLCALPAFATTWYVSPTGNDSNSGVTENAPLLTIQKAIDKSSPNDTILVEEGEYQYVTIAANKAPLTITSKGDASKTIIKGAYGYRCVTIGDGTTTNIFLNGFTLTGGRSPTKPNKHGAGALGGTYNNCIITNNYSGEMTACAAGAHSCTLNNCLISNNTCHDWDGGIANCIASNCVIRGNVSNGPGAHEAGGSILINCQILSDKSLSGKSLSNCQLYGCTMEFTGAYYDSPFIRDGCKAYNCVIKISAQRKLIEGSQCYNCTIVSTAAARIYRATEFYNCIISSSGNALQINGDGNWGVALKNCLLNNVSLGSYVTTDACITADPKFKNGADYSLQDTSPCINAGENSYVSTMFDYLGNKRISSGRVDIGAYEYREFYNVSFMIGENAQCVNGSLTQSIQEGLSATLPEISTNDGYWFLGWDKSCENITANTTINAQIAKVEVIRGEEDIGLTISDISGWNYYYTLNGTTPTKDSTKYNGRVSISLKGSHSIRILGVSDAGVESEVYSYEIAAPAMPVITASTGAIFSEMQSISISCDTEGAMIYYTVDGSEPTTESTPYRRFRITGKTTVKAIAVVEGQSWSETAVAHYALGQCEDPVISLSDGSTFLHSNQEVSITSGTEGVLRYTLDGSEPTNESMVYAGPFTISESTVIKAKVFSDSYFDSKVITATLTREWEEVAAPVITAATSFTGSKTQVAITCATIGATIYYTKDGTEPTATSNIYSEPFDVASTCTIKAYAVLNDYTDSNVCSWDIEKVWGIGDSLGSPDQIFVTSGNKQWERDANISKDGVESMRSGIIGNAEESVLETKVQGRGTITFWWKSSTEDSGGYFDWDHGEFHADGEIFYIDAKTDWVKVSYKFTNEGEHTLKWIYVKDDFEKEGEDCIWVDAFTWTPEPQFVETQTTTVPIPFSWLKEKYPTLTDVDSFEAKANEFAANGINKVWECYVAGIEPTDSNAKFVTVIEIINNKPRVTWKPDLNNGTGKIGVRTYKIFGSTNLKSWTPVNDGEENNFNFFKVEVSMP